MNESFKQGNKRAASIKNAKEQHKSVLSQGFVEWLMTVQGGENKMRERSFAARANFFKEADCDNAHGYKNVM